MKNIITILFVLIFVQYSYSQIRGQVFEDNKNNKSPITGVNVFWHDKSAGTTTDINGRFELAKTSSSSKLVFSYIGYISDTVEINNQKGLRIYLKSGKLLDEVSIKERKQGTSISRIDPLNTQNITGEELGHAACCNLGESFETNASVDASYSDAATGAKQIKLLGLEGKYVQMLTENIPNFYGLGSLYGLGYIPGSWMKSISVSKGTSTVSYGYKGITGQINTWYKEPEKLSDYFYLNMLASTSGKTEINLDGTIKINDKIGTSLLFHTEKNWLKHDTNNDGFMDMPSTTQYNFFNRYSFNFSKRFKSKIGIKLLDETRNGGQVDYNHNESINNQNSLYGIQVKTKRLEAFVKGGYIFDTNLKSSLAFISNFTDHTQNSFYGHTTYNANQKSAYANIIYTSDILNANHNIKTGVSYEYENYDEQLNTINIDRIEHIPGAFLEYTAKPIDKLTVIAGFRADYNNIYGMFYTPRVHLKSNLTGSTTIRGSVGKAYRTGSIIAENSYLLASSRQIVIANNIQAEQAWNAGGNITQYIPAGNKEITLQLEYYRTQFVNQIVVDLDSDVNKVSFYNLNGESYSNIYQIEVQYPFVEGLSLTAAFRYNDVKQTIGNELKRVPLSSLHKGLLSASYKTPLGKWQFDFTTQVNGGGRIPSTAQNSAEFQQLETFEPYTIINFQITKFFKNWDIYAGVENLTNFTQKNPIIDANNPFGDNFDASLIWGPIHGRKFYFAFRYRIPRMPTQHK